jgi:hypothetical protein
MVGRPDGSTARYVEETKALAESLLVDAAFPGELQFSAVARIYRESDVFVRFSEHEGFGLPIFEAMRVDTVLVEADALAQISISGNWHYAMSQLRTVNDSSSATIYLSHHLIPTCLKCCIKRLSAPYEPFSNMGPAARTTRMPLGQGADVRDGQIRPRDRREGGLHPTAEETCAR